MLLSSGPVMLRLASAEHVSIGATSIGARLSVGDLVALVKPPAWHGDAACKEHLELSWFPELGDPTDALKSICEQCLVRSECLEASLEDPLTVGVWGGLSGRQRKERRKSIERQPRRATMAAIRLTAEQRRANLAEQARRRRARKREASSAA